MAIVINYTTGYAGTGKSHSLIKLVDTLPLDSTVIIAPTHKALHRLRDHLPDTAEVKTIHALLGWVPGINENATRIEHIDSTIKLDRPLDEYTNIVIDEAGMMSEEMLFEITGKIEDLIGYDDTPVVTIHCYLDPYQLLPVKGTQIQLDPDTTTKLTKQYRSESLDVVNLYTKFVHYIEGINTDDLTTPYSENVRKFDISKFKEGDRLLAYTNKAVGDWNKRIAKHLNINSYVWQRVQLGSKLETVECIKFIEPSLRELLTWFEDGTLDLQNSQINKKFLESSLNALIYNKDIQFMLGGDNYVYPVIVGIGNANVITKEAKERALQDKSQFRDVYALGRAYIMDYSFASTVHKSQGSEWDNIFIDKNDIQKSIRNNYYTTYARLMYVAISRCKKIIYI